jgi:hypothetical protein
LINEKPFVVMDEFRVRNKQTMNIFKNMVTGKEEKKKIKVQRRENARIPHEHYCLCHFLLSIPCGPYSGEQQKLLSRTMIQQLLNLLTDFKKWWASCLIRGTMAESMNDWPYEDGFFPESDFLSTLP